MDAWIIGSGLFASSVAAFACWFGIRRWHKQEEAERKRERARQKRAKKVAHATILADKAPDGRDYDRPTLGEPNGLPNSGALYGGLNGTDRSLHGRGEHQ